MTTLRQAAQRALDVLIRASSYYDTYAEITALRAALEQPEQEPVACFIGIKGSAFDLPTTKRAYTYEEQPGNVVAWKLGQSLETAKRFPPGGDSIDDGLALLKTLQAEGFGVFQLGAEYTALRDALEQPEPEPEPEPEPVAWIESPHGAIRANPLYRMTAAQSLAWSIPLYTTPPRREWQSLSLEAVAKALADAGLQPEDYREDGQILPLVRAIEAALKERNHG
jgi:hypothetical protein